MFLATVTNVCAPVVRAQSCELAHSSERTALSLAPALALAALSPNPSPSPSPSPSPTLPRALSTKHSCTTMQDSHFLHYHLF